MSQRPGQSANNNRATTHLALLIRLQLALFLPAAVISTRLSGWIFWLLVLTGMVCFALPGKQGRHPLETSPALWAAVLIPLLLNLGSVLVVGGPARDVSWVLLLGLPFLVSAFRFAGGPSRYLVFGASAACVVALGVALLAHAFPNGARSSLPMNPLLFGMVTMTCVVIVAWATPDRNTLGLGLLAPAALICGLAAFLLSGFRGGLLVLPILIVALRRLPTDGITQPVPWRQVLGVIAIIVTAFALFKPTVLMFEKIGSVDDEIDAFRQGKVAFSSVGSRLALWRASFEMFQANPVLGIGSHRFQSELRNMRAQGSYPTDAQILDHPHNTYLTIAVENGLLGVVLMGLSLVLLLRCVRSADAPGRQLALLMLFAWMLMFLTNDFLRHQTSIRVMLVVLATCLTAHFAVTDRPAILQTDQKLPESG